MLYAVEVRLIDSSPYPKGFSLVEKTVWYYANGGRWNDHDGMHTLTMGGSGTSGALRYRNEDSGESFVVVVGIHNYKWWGAVVTDLDVNDTATKIQPTFYGSGERNNSQFFTSDWNFSRRSKKGRAITVAVTQYGPEYHVDVTVS